MTVEFPDPVCGFCFQGNVWEQVLRVPFILEMISAVPFMITVSGKILGRGFFFIYIYIKIHLFHLLISVNHIIYKQLEVRNRNCMNVTLDNCSDLMAKCKPAVDQDQSAIQSNFVGTFILIHYQTGFIPPT